ncbi:epimerase [Haloprofundus marisrubri]|uniref:Epimerase n=1 Tax=Haloprofundus marisrubri TaxID=1514971 RepID=A0A0W1R9Z2_9EURY|nr:NAD-dependent epimerase/dehydratase family protein [Haloprofundus marisrubri]KTG10171.1 epimerase [Haloprofundus marisrubri]
MRVFVAGSTGVLGRRLVSQFADRGHEVVGLTRDAAGDEAVAARGGEPVRGDLFDADSLALAAEGADTVIHAATAIPSDPQAGEAAWEKNDRVRREGTRALTTAAASVGASQYLQQSIVWVAANDRGDPFDESSPPRPTRITQSAVDAEQISMAASENAPFSTAILRCGVFYAPDAAHTRQFAERLLRRRLPAIGRGPLGRGDVVIAPIHADDAASAFVAAAESEIEGIWHVVDDESVSTRAFLRTFADYLDAPKPLSIPAWVARATVGSAAVSQFTTSMRTSNEPFRAATDWQPTYPTHHEGLRQVVDQWRRDGTLDALRAGSVDPSPTES